VTDNDDFELFAPDVWVDLTTEDGDDESLTFCGLDDDFDGASDFLVGADKDVGAVDEGFVLTGVTLAGDVFGVVTGDDVFRAC
jgi:hypothetical protein